MTKEEWMTKLNVVLFTPINYLSRESMLLIMLLIEKYINCLSGNKIILDAFHKTRIFYSIRNMNYR